MIAGVARYLLTLRNAQGLIKGGPDVNWVSTQHNLLAAGFMRDLASKIGTRGTLGTGLSYTEIGVIMGLEERPSEKAIRALAEAWRPHRGAAAVFAWHHRRAGAPAV